MSVEKVIRGGMVAVLYSPGYGAGWSTWQDSEFVEVALYHPAFVDAVERDELDEDRAGVIARVLGLKATFYLGGHSGLQIEWLPVGAKFVVDEYDGHESIQVCEKVGWMVA